MKKIMIWIMAIIMAMAGVQVAFADEDQQAYTAYKCGEDCYYTIDQEGKVEVFGEGSIDDNAFYSREDVTSLKVHDGVKKIGFGAFSKCSNLTKVTLPESLKTIEGSAFLDCTKLLYFHVPATVTKIGAFAIGMEFKYVVYDPDIDPRLRPVGAWFAPLKDFVMMCYKDTAGEEYAKYNHITHIVSKPLYYDFKYKLSKKTFTYDGKIHKPSVYVSLGKESGKATYQVKYLSKKPINPGVYQIEVTVSGKDYVQKNRLSYKIRPKATALKKAAKSNGGVKVVWKKAKGKVHGYEVKVGSKTKIIKGQNKTKTFVKGTNTFTKASKSVKKQGAKVRVRTYYKGKSGVVYSKWSKALVI